MIVGHSTTKATQRSEARGTGKPRRRLCDVEVLDRREAVRLALVEERWTMGTRSALCQRFGVSDRQLRLDRDAVLPELRDGMDASATAYRERLAGRFRHTFTLAIGTGELGAAVSATREEGKMMGVYAPERQEHQHSGSVDVNIKSPDEQGRNILRALAAVCQVVPPDEVRGYLEAALAELPVSTVIDVEAE